MPLGDPFEEKRNVDLIDLKLEAKYLYIGYENSITLSKKALYKSKLGHMGASEDYFSQINEMALSEYSRYLLFYRDISKLEPARTFPEWLDIAVTGGSISDIKLGKKQLRIYEYRSEVAGQIKYHLDPEPLSYLNKYSNADYYLSSKGGVDGYAVPENEIPKDVAVKLLIRMYDRTGLQVFARTYERKYENTLGESVPAVDVYEHYLKQLINDSAEAMNKDLAFLKTAATPTGPTLKDYLEGKGR